MPAGTPFTFYDSDPRNGNANKLGTFNLPDEVPGKCCGYQYTYILDANKPGVNTIYAVLNDNGSTMPLSLPNTTIPETNYNNNIAVRNQFQFKITVLPATATLEPGDSLQLSSTAGPGNATYSWKPVQNMSCTDCANPLLIATKDTIAKLIATSQYGCVDSGFSVIKVPPADDYTITVNSIDCAKNNQLYATFTVCNSFKRGIIPKGLKVSFYDADPANTSAHLLGPVFSTAIDSNQKCASFGHLFEQIPPGKIFAVVNDNGTTIPLQLPNTVLTEKNYTNNKNSFDYLKTFVTIQPADTTVFRKQAFAYNVSTNISNPAAYKWNVGNGYKLSCTNCATPTITVLDSGTVNMQVTTQYGCIIPAQAHVKIFPPDMTLEILETACYTNETTLVKFKINMNNGYDSVFKDLPVSFYDASPSTRNPRQLTPKFVTKETTAGSSAIFTQIIESPASKTIYGVVNDKSGGLTAPPDVVFNETNYNNNVATKNVVPFTLTVIPGDTSIQRSTPIQLQGQVSGGQSSIILWGSSPEGAEGGSNAATNDSYYPPTGGGGDSPGPSPAPSPTSPTSPTTNTSTTTANTQTNSRTKKRTPKEAAQSLFDYVTAVINGGRAATLGSKPNEHRGDVHLEPRSLCPATWQTSRAPDPWPRIRILLHRNEPAFSSLWRLDLCARTLRGLAFFFLLP